MTVWELMSEVRSNLPWLTGAGSGAVKCADAGLLPVSQQRHACGNEFTADHQAFHTSDVVFNVIVQCFGYGTGTSISRNSRTHFTTHSLMVSNAKLATKAVHLEWGPAMQAARELIRGVPGGTSPPANDIREALGLRIVPRSTTAPMTPGTPSPASTSATNVLSAAFHPSTTYHAHGPDPWPWPGRPSLQYDDANGDGERLHHVSPCDVCRCHHLTLSRVMLRPLIAPQSTPPSQHQASLYHPHPWTAVPIVRSLGEWCQLLTLSLRHRPMAALT